MNLAELLKAPGLQIAAACWLFLQFAPTLRQMPSELNTPIAWIGGIAALVAVALPLVDLVAAVRKK